MKANVSENSSLRKHFIAPILPSHNSLNPIQPPAQFIKNKDFFKPEKFIWNNPHRTSKKMYPYYHQANEEYENTIKPVLDELVERERKESEEQKIKKMIEIREDLRDKFFNRKKSRIELTMKAGSRENRYSTADLRQKNGSAPHYSLKTPNLSVRESQRVSTQKSRSTSIRNPERDSLHSERLSIPQQTFIESLKKYDTNIGELKKIICNQIQENHQKIRSQFVKKKEENLSLSRNMMAKRNIRAFE